MGACHRTSNGQEHKIIWSAGPERDPIFTDVSQRAESKAATGKNTKLFGVLDQNVIRFFTDVSQRAESKAATVATSD